MLTKEQFELLLKNQHTEKIIKIFSKYGFENIRIYKAKFSDEYNKINFLVSVKTGEEKSFSDFDAKMDISEMIDFDQINISIIDEIDKHLRPIIERDCILFNSAEVQNLYNTEFLAYDIDCKQNDQGIITLTVNINPNKEVDINELVEKFKNALNLTMNNESSAGYSLKLL